ncbi:IS5 family transposase [Streptomyces netropsis]|uniref:IS5 family transposase n=1 Tax=Streptomyces netropsis TaxID=55404 RepID=UPI00379D71E7
MLTGHGAANVGLEPDGLWEIAKPLTPPSRVQPQGGGAQDMPDETVSAAMVYVLVSGCSWRALPPCFGILKSTAHRWFLIWSRAGVWGGLHEAVLHRLDDAGLTDVTHLSWTPPMCGRKGGRTHRSVARGAGQAGFQGAHLSDQNGLPLIGVSATNTHDSEALRLMVLGSQTRHAPHRGRHFKPQRLDTDKSYDIPELRKWLRGKRIGVRIARKGIESSERLGRRSRVIERTMSRLTGYRRLNHRYQRHSRNYLALLGPAAAICIGHGLRVM